MDGAAYARQKMDPTSLRLKYSTLLAVHPIRRGFDSRNYKTPMILTLKMRSGMSHEMRYES